MYNFFREEIPIDFHNLLFVALIHYSSKRVPIRSMSRSNHITEKSDLELKIFLYRVLIINDDR